MRGKILPETAVSSDYVSLGYTIEIDTKKGLLKLTEPKLSYQQFSIAMKALTHSDSLFPAKSKIATSQLISISYPIQTALKEVIEQG